jgi:putative membrane-bound dehydrogenase-like protein
MVEFLLRSRFGAITSTAADLLNPLFMTYLVDGIMLILSRFTPKALLLVASMSLFAETIARAAEPLNRTPSPGEYQTPAETAANMKLPEGFQVKVFAGEPDVYQPIGFCTDARGRLWVLENYSYPDWGPEGRDQVVIFEDADGDGKFDNRKVFWDKGNFASGIQVGFGGVWIGSPPNLLFIPDRDGDDQPDGEPQVLLDGWEHQDTHETLNSFIWGPDGWLYGCQGVFTQSLVGKPGTPENERIPVNAAVWRYHPTRHQFEIFAEGGSNQWGVDFNDHGQAFMTACVIPHLFHVVQGGRYTRQAGQHRNPYTYDDIKTIRTHKHFAAAFAGAMIYLGDNFPSQYRNQIFMNNIHANKVHVDWLEPNGTSFLGKYGPHDREPEGDDRGAGWMDSGDKWYRGISLQAGPDGSVFVCDWYDRLPCHQVRPHDRTNGRIYKFSYGEPKAVASVDVSCWTIEQLVQAQSHPNDWWVRTSRRVLQERTAMGADMSEARTKLKAMLDDQQLPVPTRLRALWALHGTGGLDDAWALPLLQDAEPYVRSWTIQSLAERGSVAADVATRFVEMAKSDDSPIVRLYLASACQRLPAETTWPIVEQLVTHGEDADDPNLPLLIWYAAEPLVAADKARGAKLAAQTKVPSVRQYIARRIVEK